MIGRKIHKIRKKRGLTLSELADRANISKSYLSNIERNLKQNPSILVMEKIATVLDVELHTLLEITSDSTMQPESAWVEFARELQESGIEKEQLKDYKTVLEFIKWQNRNCEGKNNV
ncbi:helix-turn-helix domain-containing protein [Jeotgalibacillus soli]|uniref:HTH cro/C1-type domain-containing protein n=1 Tax=Jeotgalibacillus soli TaxID=889306 RepID=A0A0C2RGQ3_9BACL|nr:helix-turn-helix transcriptional regulator [Jeotgalibacillus soli]KIL49355.1 hypothetical protein KP78_08230 [Jeotgalibacillus soli]